MKKIFVIFSCVAIFTACSSDSEKTASTDSASTEAAVSEAPADSSSTDTASTSTTVTTTTTATPAAGTPAATTPAAAAPAGAIVINISTVSEEMRFDLKMFKVKAGQKVILNISNNDSQQHNLIIGKIGSLNKLGAAADALAMDPKAAELEYVPRSSDIFQASSLLNADENYTMTFTAPAQAGDYPFICAFPGHWRMMQGVMRVEK
jgi:azurin